jgi:ankyrin repeat protein
MDDYTETYNNLFRLLKEHKYNQFTQLINSIDTDDIMFNINVRDDQHNYLLTYAIILNKLDIVKLLIDNGSKIDITDIYNKSLLIIPITYSYYDILELLLNINKNNIGVSIIDIKDKDMKTPLHYAIDIQNIKAISLLLEYGANPNTCDKNGYNSLHLAVKSRSYDICKLILKYIHDINSRYNTGENALHIACNLQLVDITRLLIENKINVNIQDFSHEITALHYATLLNNKELVAILLTHNANPNLQDSFGNTVMHYCLIENNFEIFIMLTESTFTKNIINMNVWNIDGDIPLHIILKNNVENIDHYLEIMINKSKLTIQDIDGNSCLYYLILLDKWKAYKNILIKKRLDIFIINSKKKMIIDIIPKKDYDEFIDLVVDSYIYRLQNAGHLWYNEWENICSKNFDILTEKEIKLLKNNISKTRKNELTNDIEHICKNIIKDKIINLIKKVKDGKLSVCHDKSYPTKNRKASTCININEGFSLEYSTFTGTTLDILVGLIYLLKKHTSACSTLTKNFSKNTDLCAFYKSIGILVNTNCEFLNFEIVWVHQRLYLMEGFYENFIKCIKNKRFVIIPIGIEMREGSHAGYLIYDHTIKEVERFEPHGSTTPPGLYYNPNLLDEILESRFKTIDENIKYIKPKDFLPKVGFQLLDISEGKRKKIGDPEGFCALWSTWYVDMRLTYKDVDRNELVKMLLKAIKSQNISFKNMIRNYGKNIIDIRDNIFKKSEMNINDWLNDQYTDVQINSIMNELNSYIDQIIK